MQGILFDLDGTLLNSEWLAAEAYNYGVRQVLKRDLFETEKQDLVGKPISIFLKKFGELEVEIMSVILDYYEHHLERIKVYDEIYYVLGKLKVEGFKMGIVTSQLKRFAEKCLVTKELRAYFDTVITADDCHKHKPDPLPLLTAIDDLGINTNHFIYIGDQPTDIKAAQAAGIESAFALWGASKINNAESLSPTYIFKSPITLLQILRI